MAIAFARSRIGGRSKGDNACCTAAYNSRSVITDSTTGITYDFSDRGDNLHHEIILPKGADKSFADTSVLANEIERIEKRKDSQLFVEHVLALPDDPEVSLEMKKEMIYEYIKLNGWVEKGYAVQIDIHSPDAENNNSHVHIFFATRKFSPDGLSLADKKVLDLLPTIKAGYNKMPFVASKEMTPGKMWGYVQNTYFEKAGLDLRVDPTGDIAQEHIGPVRMRSKNSMAAIANDEKIQANIKELNSGDALLKRATKTSNMIRESDLVRAARLLPDAAKAEHLIKEAISSDELIKLYDDKGKATGFYTTKTVREEEKKLVRLSMRVAGLASVTNDKRILKSRDLKTIIETEGDRAGLNAEQKEALSYMMLDKSGIRVIRGRAGTGKSRVLKSLASVTKTAGIETVFVAPTHKAKMELEGHFEHTNTIAGLLHGLKHGQVQLQKGSLIVVDEAGMVGDSTYSELLRVALQHKCNLVLAGDERQLSAIGRGGSFENFAEKFGSRALVDIQRQNPGWARDVAKCLSEKRIKEGVAILDQNNKIKWSNDRDASIDAIVKQWNKDKVSIKDKLIIAVTNENVNAINNKIRESLKKQGKLTGDEYVIIGHKQIDKIEKEGKSTEYLARVMPKCFMKGDRIVFNARSKELGINNGEFATITYASKDEFRVEMDGSKKEISFNPGKFAGFNHGYASTVYKAQGASITYVYVMHDGFSTKQSSYVALSRHIASVYLFCNKEATKSNNHLIKQLGFSAMGSSSLTYLTKDEVLEKQKYDNEMGENFIGRIMNKFNRRIYSYAVAKVQAFTDKHVANSDYYNYEKPEDDKILISKVLDKVHAGASNEHIKEVISYHQQELPTAVGQNVHVMAGNININIHSNVNSTPKANLDGNNTDNEVHSATKQEFSEIEKSNIKVNNNDTQNNNKASNSTKERFYAKRDYAKAVQTKQEAYEKQKEQWSIENEQLKHSIKFRAESIAIKLLGEPNRKLSSKTELRFGNKGSMALAIAGAKAGSWYDFSESKSGNLFTLVQEVKNCDFKQAAEYLKSEVGMHTTQHMAEDNNLLDKYIKYQNAKREEQKIEKAKQKKIDNLTTRGKDVTDKSIVASYLKEKRNIKLDNSEEAKQILGDDIKTTGIWRKEHNKYYPALVAFARNSEGKITGGQELLLDKNTKGKADIDLPKKSFGTIAGSFVTIGKTEQAGEKENQDKPQITVIAEGLETAISIKQAKPELKVLCALGISNIKLYESKNGEHVIIAADNDGKNANTDKVINAAREKLANPVPQSKDLKQKAHVTIVKPEKLGDFNDILQEKGNEAGTKEIRSQFKEVIAKHTNIAKDQKIEAQKLTAILKEFAAEKQSANTPEETIKAIAKEQGYLAYQAINTKHTDHDPKIMQAMQIAHSNMQMTHENQAKEQGIDHATQQTKDLLQQNIQTPNNAKVIKELKAISTHVIEKGTMSKQELTQHLKTTACPQEAIKGLVKGYQDDLLHKLNKSFDTFKEGGTITYNDKKFSCPRVLLTKIIENNKDAAYFPKQQLQKGLDNLNKQHIEHQKQKELEIRGPSL